jgi:hypothetical protein
MESSGDTRKPFVAAIATPVNVHVPGALHPSGADTWVKYEDLTDAVREGTTLCLTFEGVTIW